MTVTLTTAPYIEQAIRWPRDGRHILAHFDEETIVVYQAYRTSIGQFAIKNGFFGGDFKYSRMSWIKPNFLWMMYRSSWGTAAEQEIVLAIRLRRCFFDSLLTEAVPSSFDPQVFTTHEEWSSAVACSDVRLQWDPDHLPTGTQCERRAVQLGLRGKALETYGKAEIVEIIDMTEFVAEQRQYILEWRSGKLITPIENVYAPIDPHNAQRKAHA